MGATHCRIGLTDLGGNLLTELAGDLDISQSPEVVMPWIEDRFGDLLREAKRGKADVRAIGVGVPAPVEFALGTPVAPPIMPGWDGYPIADRLRQSYPVPVLVDKDTNTMAWGEHWMHWRETAHLVYIKVGSGIGCGIVADGRVYRGADGAAGDIGHLPSPAAESIRCICGNLGCLEAIAGGRAMAAQLTAAGIPAKDSRAVVALTRSGDQRAMALVRESGRLIGQALTSLVNLVNPRVIVIGGDIAHADHLLLAGVREIIYQRSLPLATRHLRIVRSRLDDQAGLIGAAIMAIEHILAAEVVDEALARDEDRLPATIAAG
jgi:predicted NBD/HSP70 family sugar kinase